jgi:hypothetical protein
MLLSPATLMDPQRLRLANLLLYQGSAAPAGARHRLVRVFPRMLGGDFGDPKTAAQSRIEADTLHGRRRVARESASFLEAFGQVTLRLCICAPSSRQAYLLIEVTLEDPAGRIPHHGALLGAHGLGWLGIVLAPFHYVQHVSPSSTCSTSAALAC